MATRKFVDFFLKNMDFAAYDRRRWRFSKKLHYLIETREKELAEARGKKGERKRAKRLVNAQKKKDFLAALKASAYGGEKPEQRSDTRGAKN